ncbi:leucine-rich repeat domain-containing protein [Chloroflexota bacterium]
MTGWRDDHGRGVTYKPQIVTFTDPNLEAAIRNVISQSEGPIYIRELEKVTSLYACRKNIENLSGLEYCSNLKELELGENQISDISPLAELTELKELGLELNQITDVSPLASLIKLERLWLSGNRIVNISAMSQLTTLKKLDLSYNEIRDISPLAELTKLISLYLWLNEMRDISPLAELTNLKELDLRENQINDISPLASLTNLGWLNNGRLPDILKRYPKPIIIRGAANREVILSENRRIRRRSHTEATPRVLNRLPYYSEDDIELSVPIYKAEYSYPLIILEWLASAKSAPHNSQRLLILDSDGDLAVVKVPYQLMDDVEKEIKEHNKKKNRNICMIISKHPEGLAMDYIELSQLQRKALDTITRYFKETGDVKQPISAVVRTVLARAKAVVFH